MESVLLFVHKTFSLTQESLPNGDLNADVLPTKEVTVDGHTKSD